MAYIDMDVLLALLSAAADLMTDLFCATKLCFRIPQIVITEIKQEVNTPYHTLFPWLWTPLTLSQVI